MRRKRWLLVTLAIVAFAASVTGGVTLARGGANAEGSLTSFVSRVASILGINETQV